VPAPLRKNPKLRNYLEKGKGAKNLEQRKGEEKEVGTNPLNCQKVFEALSRFEERTKKCAPAKLLRNREL